MELTDFLQADTNSRKLKADQKCLVGHGQKGVWSVLSWNSKIKLISRMTRWKKLIFCMMLQIHEN